MICSSYLAVVEIIKMERLLPGLSKFIAFEEFDKALLLARTALNKDLNALTSARIWHCIGDINLLIGWLEAAEESYAKATTLLAGNNLLNEMSCRSAGLQMLVRGRFETAASCFSKNMKSSDQDIKFEAIAISGMLLREAGLMDLATELIEWLIDIAKGACLKDWQHLGEILAHDIYVYKTVLNTVGLADHVYWKRSRSAVFGTTNALVITGTVSDEPGVYALLQARRHHLDKVAALLDTKFVIADADVVDQTPLHKRSAHHIRKTRVQVQELTLAALASGRHASATRWLNSIFPIALSQTSDEAVLGVIRPTRNEFNYLLAKSLIERGLFKEGLIVYRKYLKSTIETIRTLPEALNSFYTHDRYAMRNKPCATKGHASSLPARYKPAYEYLLLHCKREDLSVQEIAAAIGISVRSLQIQFKKTLNITPRELIAKLRLKNKSISL